MFGNGASIGIEMIIMQRSVARLRTIHRVPSVLLTLMNLRPLKESCAAVLFFATMVIAQVIGWRGG